MPKNKTDDKTLALSSDCTNDKYMLRSVAKVSQILDLFYENAELGASEIANHLGMTRGTAFRFLVTLEELGFLTKTDTSKYKLGLKFYSLGQIAYSRFDLVKEAHPILEELMETTGESAFLAVCDGMDNVVYMDHVVCKSTLRIVIAPGGKFPMHCVGLGKAMLAFQTEAVIEQYIQSADYTPFTDMSITSPEMLRKEISVIQKSGFATDNQESEIGLICYAAPILDTTGHSVAGVSVCGPVSRMNFRAEDKIQAVKRAAKLISDKVK